MKDNLLYFPALWSSLDHFMRPVTNLFTPRNSYFRFGFGKTHLCVNIEHHISTGHRGRVDLTLIEDVTVVRIT